MKLQTFSKAYCELGEGPLWHPARNSLFWLDIAEQKLYEKQFDSPEPDFDSKWDLDEIGSAMALNQANPDSLYIITDKSFGEFCLLRKHYTPIIQYNTNQLIRANDGSTSPDGCFWFGTMEKEPKNAAGNIYVITPQGEIHNIQDNFCIPNTFCWSGDGNTVFISDSADQKMFSFHSNMSSLSLTGKKLFIKSPSSASTPDGGAVDTNGNIWNAHWGGEKVVCYNLRGEILSEIKIPALQPSSCCFGGPDNSYLFITTAKEGMSKTDLKRLPQSGNVFIMKMSVKGQSIPPFNYQPKTDAC